MKLYQSCNVVQDNVARSHDHTITHHPTICPHNYHTQARRDAGTQGTGCVRSRVLRHAGTRATPAHDRHSHRHRQTVPVMAQRREDRRATTALDDKAVCDLIKCASSKTTRRHCTSKRTHGAQRRRREANSAATTPYEVRMIRAQLKIDCLSSPARWLP